MDRAQLIVVSDTGITVPNERKSEFRFAIASFPAESQTAGKTLRLSVETTDACWDHFLIPQDKINELRKVTICDCQIYLRDADESELRDFFALAGVAILN